MTEKDLVGCFLAAVVAASVTTFYIILLQVLGMGVFAIITSLPVFVGSCIFSGHIWSKMTGTDSDTDSDLENRMMARKTRAEEERIGQKARTILLRLGNVHSYKDRHILIRTSADESIEILAPRQGTWKKVYQDHGRIEIGVESVEILAYVPGSWWEGHLERLSAPKSQPLPRLSGEVRRRIKDDWGLD